MRCRNRSVVFDRASLLVLLLLVMLLLLLLLRLVLLLVLLRLSRSIWFCAGFVSAMLSRPSRLRRPIPPPLAESPELPARPRAVRAALRAVREVHLELPRGRAQHPPAHVGRRLHSVLHALEQHKRALVDAVDLHLADAPEPAELAADVPLRDARVHPADPQLVRGVPEAVLDSAAPIPKGLPVHLPPRPHSARQRSESDDGGQLPPLPLDVEGLHGPVLRELIQDFRVLQPFIEIIY
mmetsp:Transcript_57994/g.121216  ORF Transcript_57994/g.121216 Transcript_57994/m.121216 type:complete len:238 (-) Transcript_57994:1243-1956(-)